MSSNESPGKSSLLNLFKFGIFGTIYADSKNGLGCPSPPPPPSQVTVTQPSPAMPGAATHTNNQSDSINSTNANSTNTNSSKRSAKGSTSSGPEVGASDRGKTGAGVAGSRKWSSGVQEGGCSSHDRELPEGADNPGLLRHIHHAARLRMPNCFEGACVSVKQYVSDNWLMGHSIAFSSVSPGGYKMLLSYVDKNKESGLPYFVLEGSPGGQISCEMRVRPTMGTRATVMAQMADAEIFGFESTLDFFFNTFTASVIAVNREFIALHYLQNITERLSLGAEVVARGYAAEISSASGAARWTTPDYSLSATLGSRGLDLCYAKAIQPYLTVAGMLEVGLAVKRAVGTLAYEWHTDEFTVKASMDSDGLVGATLHKSLGGKRATISCAISALLNHPNNKFRLGFGINAAII